MTRLWRRIDIYFENSKSPPSARGTSDGHNTRRLYSSRFFSKEVDTDAERIDGQFFFLFAIDARSSWNRARDDSDTMVGISRALSWELRRVE